jgi:hypothetical protein
MSLFPSPNSQNQRHLSKIKKYIHYKMSNKAILTEFFGLYYDINGYSITIELHDTMLQYVDNVIAFVNLPDAASAERFIQGVISLIKYYKQYYIHRRIMAMHNYKLLTGAPIAETPPVWVFLNQMLVKMLKEDMIIYLCW